jgi:hypothetical protein
VKAIAILTIVFQASLLKAQDTSVTWMFSIDQNNFTVSGKKKSIPTEIFRSIGIDSRKQLANPHGFFSKTCVGPGKRKRFNWAASDSSGHTIISITYGGISLRTYFFL